VNRTAFYGRIFSGDPEVVTRLLETWIGREQLKVKVRLSGEEMQYEDERMSIYCQNAAGAQGGSPNYLLEGNTSATLGETGVMLQRLLDICRNAGVAATFEYVEVNEDGEEVSEEFYLR
jgi:hypothetical protein